MDGSARGKGGARRWRRAGASEGVGKVADVDGLPAPPPPPAGLQRAPDNEAACEEVGAASGRGLGKGAGAYSKAARGLGVGLAAGPYNAGVKKAFEERYLDDLARLQARPDLPPAARWLDSHCHLESIIGRTWRGGGKPQVMDHERVVDLLELVASWPPGLDGCVCNCAFRRPSKPGSPPEWAWLEANLSHFDPGGPVSGKLWFTIGIHPHDAGNWDSVAERTVRRLSVHPKCVGVGECGLDFFKHEVGEADKQLRVFEAQAALAVELGKALVVHARLVNAENEEMFWKVLSKVVPPEHPVHMHCYSGSLENARRLCERWPRLRIGFTGSITFRERAKGAGKGKGVVEELKGEQHSRAVIQALPLDRLLIETDGPYMCPEPFRGQTAHPGHVHRVAERIAEWRGCGLGEVMDATRKSTTVVYGI